MTNRTPLTTASHAVWLATLLGFSALAGCGSSEVNRYHLSGAITIDGQPVETGVILLEPDAARGNSGPGGTATIDNGYYETEAGQGTIGGPHIARITAGTGRDVTELSPYGTLYAPQEFRIPVDLPQDDAEQDFELSSSSSGN